MTICPKCAYQRLPSDTHIHAGVCPACGIAYQKYIDRQRGIAPARVTPDETRPAPSGPIKARLMELPQHVDRGAVGARAAAWCLFAAWTVWFTVHGINWEVIGGSFLHHVILPFHEFGHLLFMPFGRFMTILGGSLFQVLMPLGLMAAFVLKQRDTFGASVMLWWAGQSLVDLSPYVADAVDRAMPLVGGAGEAAHDWGNLLTMTGMLGHAQGLSRLCFALGVLGMLTGICWGARLLYLQYQALDAKPANTTSFLP